MDIANASTIALPFVGLQVGKREVGAVLTGLDILIIAYFVVFLWHLRRSFVKEVTLSNTTEITASDFTVRVQNLPPDLTDRMELLQFFQVGQLRCEGECWDPDWVSTRNDGARSPTV